MRVRERLYEFFYPRLWLAIPAVVGLLCVPLAGLLPDGQVWSEALRAVLIMSPPWLLAVWPIWALTGALWLRRGFDVAGVACVAGFLMLGRPSAPAPPVASGEVSILFTNVNAYSDGDPDELGAFIADLSPDIVVVIEKRGDAIPGMVRAADNFGADLPRESHATSVYCRGACLAEITPEYGVPDMSMPAALVRVPERALCIVGVHGPPPVPGNAKGLMPYMNETASHFRDGRLVERWGPCLAGDAVLVGGDLNAVPHSPAWRALMGGGLRDLFSEAGVFGASWPAGGGWPNLPFFHLDHVLVGPVDVVDARQLRVPESDHIGLWVRVR